MSIYNTDEFEGELPADFSKKVLMDDMKAEHYKVSKPNYANVMNEGIRYADAVVIGNDKINKDIEKYIKSSDVKKVTFNPDEDYVGPMLTLYNELIEDSVLA